MTWDALANIFQGVTTLIQSFSQDPKMAIARIGLIGLGLLLVYMGKKGYLEALLMIPMGLGMATVNAALMFFDPSNSMAVPVRCLSKRRRGRRQRQ